MLRDAFNLAQDGIERVLQRSVHRRTLRRSQLVEIPFDALARRGATHAVAAFEVSRHLFTAQHSPGDVVEHPSGIYRSS
jgi:hypothetical protein